VAGAYFLIKHVCRRACLVISIAHPASAAQTKAAYNTSCDACKLLSLLYYYLLLHIAYRFALRVLYGVAQLHGPAFVRPKAQ